MGNGAQVQNRSSATGDIYRHENLASHLRVVTCVRQQNVPVGKVETYPREKRAD